MASTETSTDAKAISREDGNVFYRDGAGANSILGEGSDGKDLDFTRPVQVARDIFWVGIYLENDPFQCHPYFINNGRESILIDPGSMLQRQDIIKKIEMACDLRDIKYIILHHQDPDLCAAVPYLEKLIDRPDL